MAKPILVFPRKLWSECISQLHRRGRMRHESGCFVLGTDIGGVKHAKHCVYYDELDAKAYSSGVCILHSTSFSSLWQICREQELTAIADIHTHRGAAFQSDADRTNPMVARSGHIALILPNYASGWIWRHRLGLFRYEGDHRWTNLSGWQARSFLKVKWSLI